MDTSIRFYNTNSSLRSPLEEERSGHSAIPLSADDDSEKLAGECEEEAASHSTPSIVAQPKQEQEAERVDVADFEAIFLRFQGPITNFIYHLIGNREQAYDLAQDVFVKAYKALLGGTVVQPGALSAWLYRIIEHHHRYLASQTLDLVATAFLIQRGSRHRCRSGFRSGWRF